MIIDAISGVGGGGKLQGSITPSSNSVTITGQAGSTQTVSLTVVGDGILSVSSSDTSIATVSLSNQIVTITSVGTGSATITVTLADGAAYLGTTATISASVYIVPNGSTVTPKNNIQTWLKCASIFDKSYTTISQVLADSSTLGTLISSQNAVDYMVRSTSWATDVCANSTAMSLIGLNNYAANTLLSDSTWLEAIANSTYIESVMNVKVPTMTSNTTPSGECSGSGIWRDAYTYYKAFDGRDDTAWTSSNAQTGTYLQYAFSDAHIIRCISLLEGSGGDYRSFGDGKVQASNDGSTWNDIYSFTSSTSKHIFVLSINTAYKYWRIIKTSNGNTNVSVMELQFYGREDV